MNSRNIIRTSVLAITIIFIFGTVGAAAKELEGEVVVSVSKKVGNINPDIYGLFMATAFRHFDGGIWAEMLKSRKFAEDDRGGKRYGVVRPWFPIGIFSNNFTVDR